MSYKASISIVLPSLQGGGAERVAVNLANDWLSRGYEVEIVLMELRGELLSALAPGICIHHLGVSRFRHAPQKLFAYFRDRKPEVTLVHMWPLTSVAVLAWVFAGLPGQLFLSEHTFLTNHVRQDLSTPLALVKACLRLTYRHASGVICVSQGVATDLANLARLPDASIQVIYNPVVALDMARPAPVESAQRDYLWGGSFSHAFISIGSLKKSKNFPLLLNAFAEVAEELDAGLVILGEGDQRSVLERQIKDLNLDRRVRLIGFEPNPDPWLRAADLFVLSSDFEGFGNVIAEALGAGTPVVSTACPHGPEEILEQGLHGILVPVGDCSALASGIRRATLHQWDSAALQRRALDFSIPNQSEAYLKFFGLITG